MIFGFGGKKKKPDAREEEDEVEEEEEIDLVAFQGAVNGTETNLAANARLVEAGLLPAKELVTDGLSRRAGIIRVDPKGDRAGVTVVVDGVSYAAQRLPKQEAHAVTQMLKLLAGLDIKVRNKAQSGGIKAEFDGRPHRLYVNTVPVEGGAERLTIRTADMTQKLSSTVDVGITDELKAKLRELCVKHGLFCVVGPPGSGTTTTLYATFRGIDCYLYQIFTIGDIGEQKLDNITAFETNMGDSLETTLLRLVRIDANVVLVDPLKDEQTAKVLLQQHESLSTLTEFPAKDVPSALLQLLKWAGDPQLVANGLNGILSQKLIRLLCPECRQAYRPNAKFLNTAGFPADITALYRKPKPPEEGEPEVPTCTKCDGIGYYGRTAMFELLEMSEEMKQLVLKQPAAEDIRRQMKKDKMLTLADEGKRLVIEGKTSLEELQRVFKTP